MSDGNTQDGAEPSPASAGSLADGIVVWCAVLNVLIALISAVQYISFAMEASK
jgi:hypothetical protein